ENEGGTLMAIESSFESLETMEKLLEMGQEEGMLEAIGQIEGILAARAPPPEAPHPELVRVEGVINGGCQGCDSLGGLAGRQDPTAWLPTPSRPQTIPDLSGARQGCRSTPGWALEGLSRRGAAPKPRPQSAS